VKEKVKVKVKMDRKNEKIGIVGSGIIGRKWEMLFERDG
jgi:lactate dehydrogenase-like 2-hydroxyacid dehydrogenase